MYEFSLIKDPNYKDDYIYQGRNEFNQIIKLEIFYCLDGYFHVIFFITSKRKKGYQRFKQTGKDGIKSLLWAKACIFDFISKFKGKYHDSVIRIYGDDKRRVNVYERGLASLGFKKSFSKTPFIYHRL